MSPRLGGAGGGAEELGDGLEVLNGVVYWFFRIFDGDIIEGGVDSEDELVLEFVEVLLGDFVVVADFVEGGSCDVDGDVLLVEVCGGADFAGLLVDILVVGLEELVEGPSLAFEFSAHPGAG